MAVKKIDIKKQKELDDRYKELITNLEASEDFMRDNNEYFDKYKKIISKQPITVKDDTVEITTATLANNIEKLAYQTIQELPEGDIVDRWGTMSTQTVICEYLLKLIRRENTSNDLSLKQKVISVFKEACTVGFSACFISSDENHAGIEVPILEPIPYSDFFPEPNCGLIYNAKWAIVRKWYSKEQLEEMKSSWDFVDDILKEKPKERYGHGQNDLNPDYSREEKTNVKMYAIYFYTSQKGDLVVFNREIGKILAQEKKYYNMNSMRVISLAIMPDDVNTLGNSLVAQNANTQLALDVALQDSIEDFYYDRNPASVIIGHIQGDADLEQAGQNFIPDGSGDIRFLKRGNDINEFLAVSQALSGLIQDSTGLAGIDISGQVAMNQANSKTHAGVQATEKMQDIITKYYDDIIIKFLSEYYTLALNILLSTFKGKSELFIDDYETVNDLQMLAEPVEDNIVEYDFDQIGGNVMVLVNAGGNKIQNKNEQIDQLNTIMQLLTQQVQTDPNAQTKIDKIMSKICDLMGVEDYDEIFGEQAGEQQQTQQPEQQPSEGMQMAQQIMGAMGNQAGTPQYAQSQMQQQLPLQQQQAQQNYENSNANQQS
jgi:hypothetical protein